MSTTGVGASALATENSPAPARPNRYMRRAPWRSTSLPAVGPSTAVASSGPVIAHVIVVVSESRSSAMRSSELLISVMLNPTANSPSRMTARTVHGSRVLTPVKLERSAWWSLLPNVASRTIARFQKRWAFTSHVNPMPPWTWMP